MTRAEFEDWISQYINLNEFTIHPCNCKDINCKGWSIKRIKIIETKDDTFAFCSLS